MRSMLTPGGLRRLPVQFVDADLARMEPALASTAVVLPFVASPCRSRKIGKLDVEVVNPLEQSLSVAPGERKSTHLQLSNERHLELVEE